MAEQHYQWAIIGAGPAGIATVGQLLDNDIPANDILWLDPNFNVGDFGTRWLNVPSNTKVKLFQMFLTHCKAFEIDQCPQQYDLFRADPDATCLLRVMAEPLQWVSDRLKNKVVSQQTFAEKLTVKDRLWHIQTKQQNFRTKNVVLATGSEPKILNHNEQQNIPLQHALNYEKIADYFNHDDTVAVFGSSHSAILAIRYLTELPVKKVINFYLEPLRYAVYMDNWILFDDTGLKGTTAIWAREHIDGTLPTNLERYLSHQHELDTYLPLCNKAVDAIGFERRHLPIVDGISPIQYNDKCGIIAPGLFGCGIAYPEGKRNPFDILEHRVGLWKFMDYLKRIIPIWLKYSL